MPRQWAKTREATGLTNLQIFAALYLDQNQAIATVLTDK